MKHTLEHLLALASTENTSPYWGKRKFRGNKVETKRKFSYGRFNHRATTFDHI